MAALPRPQNGSQAAMSRYTRLAATGHRSALVQLLDGSNAGWQHTLTGGPYHNEEAFRPARGAGSTRPPAPLVGQSSLFYPDSSISPEPLSNLLGRLGERAACETARAA